MTRSNTLATIGKIEIGHPAIEGLFPARKIDLGVGASQQHLSW